MNSSRGRSSTEDMASIPFATRLRTTFSSCTPPARQAGPAPASAWCAGGGCAALSGGRGRRRFGSAIPTRRGRDDAEARGGPHELGHRPRLHLVHHVAALLLDGDLARPQLGGDLLVEQTGDDAGHHVALSRGERGVPVTELDQLASL